MYKLSSKYSKKNRYNAKCRMQNSKLNESTIDSPQRMTEKVFAFHKIFLYLCDNQ